MECSPYGDTREPGEGMADVDVTEHTSFRDPDTDPLALTRCICGKRFRLWEATLSSSREDVDRMPCCGRRLYFSAAVRIFEKTD